ncbi:MAG: HigA family addiction module antidote protein [Lachnospiraceae bacterium]|nr:HigA family addiction module antidote protein [Lachnospiraceae bacterium]
MSNYIEYNDKMAFHPGYYIKEIIDDSGLTQEDFAKRLDTTPKNLSLLIRGEQSLSIDIATKLSRMMDTSVLYWLNLQNEYDAVISEAMSDEMLAKEKKIFKVLNYSYFCKNFGLSESVGGIEDQIRELRRFLNVASLTVLEKENLAVSFRSETVHLSENERIIANAMVQIATNTALMYGGPKFDKTLFGEAIEYALTLTDRPDFYNEVRKAFLKAGVRLVVIPNLLNSQTNGATKKVGNGIMLMVNDRETYADSFWFTMFHEIGHIMLGDFGISLEKENGQKEKAANEYARNALIPDEKYKEFMKKGDYSESSVKEFAESIDRDPGIVIGRLIHDKLASAETDSLDRLRKKYRIYRNDRAFT